jgi:hypothetical protein
MRGLLKVLFVARFLPFARIARVAVARSGHAGMFDAKSEAAIFDPSWQTICDIKFQQTMKLRYLT